FETDYFFNKEIKSFIQIFIDFKNYIETKFAEQAPDLKLLLQELDVATIPHTISLTTGIIIDQMGSKNGRVDYEYLTRIGGNLPYYLDLIRDHIRVFS